MKFPFVKLYVLASLWLFISCRSENISGIEKIERTFENGKPEFIVTYSEQDSSKIAEKYLYEDGKTKAEGEIKSEKRNGTWYSYYNNGNKWSMNTYIDGVLHGPYQTWHENGQLFQVGQLESGKPTGIWKFYNEKGELTKEHDCAKEPMPWNSPTQL
ncbi:MAG: hypothetical protein SH856_05135 [Flavobacteriales bacterium]|nr:hypothetical protein [Flavobacteriales bacterium]